MPELLGNVFGIVVTYYPAGDILRRFGKMRNIVDTFAIIDNSADSEILSGLNVVCEQIGAQIVANPKNLGVAAALNQGIRLAHQCGADWILFFDQDTCPMDAFRREMNRIVTGYFEQKPIGIVGSNYIKSNDSRNEFPISEKRRVSYVHTSSVITSGSIHKLDMIQKIGLFKEEYFVDCVDIEYCWRAGKCGYTVLRSLEPLMTHSIGQGTEHSVFGYKTGTSNHSAFRRYFMTRNAILLAKEYMGIYPLRSMRILFSRLKSTILMCLFENERVHKLNCTAFGLWHGLVGRKDIQPRWLPK